MYRQLDRDMSEEVLCLCATVCRAFPLQVLVFFHRWMLAPMLVAMSAWPFLSSVSASADDWRLAAAWALLCTADAVFPLLPLEKESDVALVYVDV
jgi:hypothetical protein